MIKVFKISKVAIGSEEGLLDSGATHSLRGRRAEEDLSKLRQIEVTLACGRTILKLKMTRGGTMVADDEKVEPIIPLGKMIMVLKRSMDWTEESGLTVWHPNHGWLPVKQRGGCPHIPKDLAMKLIEEIEEKVTSEEGEDLHEVKKAEEKRMQEERWLQDFVECHPVLKKLPEKLKKKLVVKIPEKVGKIPPGVNRSQEEVVSKGPHCPSVLRRTFALQLREVFERTRRR